jgi:phosphonate transport system permease protein
MGGIKMADLSLYSAADQLLSRKRLLAFGLPTLVLVYLTYIFFAFDVGGLYGRIRFDNVKTLVSDSYSYKTHVERDNRTSKFKVAIEGERKGSYPPDRIPVWVTPIDQGLKIDLGAGHIVTMLPQNALSYDLPGYGQITAQIIDGKVTSNFGDAPPDWVSLSPTRLNITTAQGRISLTRNRTEVFRYFTGWELFFFAIESPYFEKSFAQIAFGPRLSDAHSNLVGAWNDFWYNPMWRHADVLWAIGETILMAFLGTFGGAMIALPLAFLAARNFTPLGSLRFAARRLFDFLRGVDGLIWTIVLSRAYGPGPLTGALAMLLTDTGSFGKMFSEALENVDQKQIEGIRSTGANAIQRSRFGVLPQITPILLSQVLYFLESNTRSATIIGAITGGGIGLLLTQAMLTQKDWEEVTYYVILIILMVFMMDSLSGWLRRKLIKGE